jgi:hypothetical protein
MYVESYVVLRSLTTLAMEKQQYDPFVLLST